jgi:hypothetical protein|tara:strand:+ start:1118 stop:1354 length:237 start_codon:yes stop_codon:yes gene_type:complete
MATWTISDDLDTRLRQRVGDDVELFVENIISVQLDCENDPLVQAELIARSKRGMAEIESGQGIEAGEAKQQLNRELGF